MRDEGKSLQRMCLTAHIKLTDISTIDYYSYLNQIILFLLASLGADMLQPIRISALRLCCHFKSGNTYD